MSIGLGSLALVGVVVADRRMREEGMMVRVKTR
jgi:hypothetical protein